jgi:uncharacterized protein (DUF342 family)
MSRDRKKLIAEDLLAESQSWLQDLEQLNQLTETLAGENLEPIHDDVRREEMKQLSQEFGLLADGRVDVHLSDDLMTCSADFIPPHLDGKFPSIIDVEDAVNSIKLEEFDRTAAAKALEELWQKQEPIFGVALARGILPVDRVPEHVVLVDDGLSTPDQLEERGGQVDFRQINPFVIVEKGDVIGRIIPETEGQNGSTLTGRVLKFGITEVSRPKIGPNIHREGNKLIADCTGTFYQDQIHIEIRELLRIGGDVGYKTGHIDFPGDVLITGTIKDGFSVSSGKDILAENTLDASKVQAAGNLIAKKGLIGRGDASVKVGGFVKAKFIERCHVESAGDVEVEVGMMNSVINSGGIVKSGTRGILVGGKVVSLNGVDMFQIGNHAETPTTIIAGVDYRILQKLEWIRNKNIEITDRIQKLRHQAAASKSTAENLQEMETQLRASLLKLNETAQQLIPHLHRAEDARITARGVVYPGTYIEICHISFIVTRPMNHAAFVLDKIAGEIVVLSA